MAAKKRKQKQTLREFRAWLEGVEELQPENWSPNRDQWARIRERIDGIKEEPVPAPAEPAAVQPAATAAPAQNPVMYQQPAMMAPPVPGGVPAGQVEMTPEARRMLNPGTGAKAKTPDIDTSDGNVESSFA